MKRLFIALALLCFLGAARAQKNVINSQIVSVSVSPKHIVAVYVYDLTVGNRATEFYKSIDRRFMMPNINPRVSSDGQNFQFVERWAPAASYEEKQQKCGLLQVGSTVQICFGLQRNARKNYLVTTGLVNMMYTTPQADVLEFPFIDDGRDSPAQKAEMRISLNDRKLTRDDLETELCWADGDWDVRDGVVYVQSDASNNRVTRLGYRICFKKGTIPGLPEKSLLLKPKAEEVGNVQDGNADGKGGNPQLSDKFTAEELSSPMMMTNSAKSESGSWGVMDFIEKNPLTSACIGWGVVILLYVFLRKLIKKII